MLRSWSFCLCLSLDRCHELMNSRKGLLSAHGGAELGQSIDAFLRIIEELELVLDHVSVSDRELPSQENSLSLVQIVCDEEAEPRNVLLREPELATRLVDRLAW